MISLEIASGIGPALHCMCDDITRTYYNSEKYWFQSVTRILELIDTLTNTRNRDVIETLLGHHDGLLLQFLIQSFFWSSHRKDIVQKSNAFKMPPSFFEDVEKHAGYIILDIMKEVDEGVEGTGVLSFGERGERRMKELALMPIVNQGYGSCDQQFVFGILDAMKQKDFPMKKAESKQFMHRMLDAFAVVPGCYDEEVISEIISLGSTTFDLVMATELVQTIFEVLCVRNGRKLKGRGHQVKEDDLQFAIGINYGLIEMALKVLARHGESISEHVHNIIDSVRNVALLRKSSSSLQNQYVNITRALNMFGPLISESDAQCQKIVQMIKTIMATIPADKVDKIDIITCLRCQKELQESQIERCGACKKAIYCSRECQVDDWNYGEHKYYCKTLAANAKKVKESGGSNRDVKKYLAHLEKIKQAGEEVLLRKIDKMLVQAFLLRYDINDCVAVVGLHLDERQNSLTVKLTDQFLQLYGKRVPDDAKNAKKLIDNHREQGRLVCAYKTDDAIAISYLDKSLSSADSWSTSFQELTEKMMKSKAAAILPMSLMMAPTPNGAERLAETVTVMENGVAVSFPKKDNQDNQCQSTVYVDHSSLNEYRSHRDSVSAEAESDDSFATAYDGQSDQQRFEQVGKNVVVEKIDNVLVQAVLLRYDINDCVAVVDLQFDERQSSLRVMLTDQFLELYNKCIPNDTNNAKKLIDNHREQGRLVCACKTDDAIAISYIDKSLASADSWSTSYQELEEKMIKNQVAAMLPIIFNMAPSAGAAEGLAEIVTVMKNGVVVIIPEKDKPGQNTVFVNQSLLNEFRATVTKTESFSFSPADQLDALKAWDITDYFLKTIVPSLHDSHSV